MSRRKIKAELILSNGRRFKGFAFGHIKEVCGDIIFSTRVTGYQQMITDPSFAGQILTLAYPLAGNVGINLEDMESDSVKVKGLVVRELCSYPSNWRCEIGLSDFLRQHKVMGLEGIDTRALTRTLRDEGPLKAIITTRASELTPSQLNQKFLSIHNLNVVKEVSTKKIYRYEGTGVHVAIIDLGIKKSLINQLLENEASVTVFPYSASCEEILSYKPDCVLISNGPGSPLNIPSVIDTVSDLLGKTSILGVDLGNLVIACAMGCEISRLKFGHYGNNHPVLNVSTNEIYVTSQNHDYIISKVSDNCNVSYTNINDNSIAGICNESLAVYGIAFIPQFSNSVKNIDNSIVKFLNIVKGGVEIA